MTTTADTREHDLWREFFADDDYVRMVGSILTTERTAAEVAALSALLGLEPGSRVLDLGCGQGRIAVPLAVSGAVVTGWDGCAPLLDVAAAAARSAGVTVDWVHADFVNLDRTSEFDAAFNVGTALGYAAETDDRATLAAVRGALRPDGVFVIDTENRERMLSSARRTWFERAGDLVCCQRDFDVVTSRWHETLRWTTSDGTRRERSYSLRLYGATELVNMLRDAGFLGDVTVHGGLDGAPHAEGSPRLVVRASVS
ncbi:class I SAM-dependent methyltransferase [Lentzea kentuckyensis]|uniref:class I SAM-dependent methyltransferase n=1 Tax=Lentzea kentuckyensis TaxID=360086 RepID=UPI000A3913D2|nr:class I SAM-dependent methyltransferase [Lentzea kentuckyensis]